MSDFDFDHAIILTDDLAAAGAGLERLGFRPTPTGYHGNAKGTENATIVLPDGETYFEILAVRKPTDRNIENRTALAQRGRHLFGMAVKGEAAKLAGHFASVGAAGEPPFDFSREVALPGGTRAASFTIATMKPQTLPGLYGFVCQHHTPDVVWRDDYLEQPNGVQGIVGLWGVAPDPLVVAPRWSAVFGERAGPEPDGLMVARLGRADVRYLTPAAWESRFGFAPPADPAPRLLAFEFAVADLDRSAAFLDDNGVAASWQDDKVVVADAPGLGTTFMFSAA